jgi:hypothetical protein
MEPNRSRSASRLRRAVAVAGIAAVVAGSALLAPSTVTGGIADAWPYARVAQSARLRAGLSAVEPGAVAVIRFSLGSFRGTDIFVPGAPGSVEVGCASRAALTTPPADAQAHGALTYDATGEVYTYLWVTSQTWLGTCRRLSLGFTDGSLHEVLIWFGNPFDIDAASANLAT